MGNKKLKTFESIIDNYGNFKLDVLIISVKGLKREALMFNVPSVIED